MPTELLEFARIETAVRHGHEPNNPTLLGAYIAMANNMVSLQQDKQSKSRLHFRVAGVLLDTICDTYVPRHWRNLCLDNIYQPIRAAERLASSEREMAKVRLFRYELNTLGTYFM